jgi:hypothetical protein
VSVAGHALLDEVMLASFRMLYGSDLSILPRLADETSRALLQFERAGWLHAPQTYHRTPQAVSRGDIDLRSVRFGRARYEHLSFESGYEPHVGEPGRDRWLGYERNHLVHAWVLRHDEPRPWLVCVHGARMGRPTLDLAAFRARWLHEVLGLNLVFPVQPLHGPRRRGLPREVTYPGPDVMDNVHGAAQAVWDVRRVLSWIRTEDPCVPIGLIGVSLGGYNVALVGSLESDLACAVLGAPCVDVVDLMEHHSRMELPTAGLQAFERAHRIGRVVAPLALSPAIPHERRFLYAGVADRFVHPRHQVVRLWEHWGRPEIHWYLGGHVLFSRSASAWGFVEDALARSGLVHSAESRGRAAPSIEGDDLTSVASM